MLQYPTSQAQPFPAPASVQDGFPQGPLSMPVPSMEQPPFAHEQHSVDPSDQPLEFNSRKAPDMPIHTTVASNHDAAAASTHSWMPSVALGFHSRPPVPPQVAQVNINCNTHPLLTHSVMIHLCISYCFDRTDGSLCACCTTVWSNLRFQLRPTCSIWCWQCNRCVPYRSKHSI